MVSNCSNDELILASNSTADNGFLVSMVGALYVGRRLLCVNQEAPYCSVGEEGISVINGEPGALRDDGDIRVL